jgi:hypothetical protein
MRLARLPSPAFAPLLAGLFLLTSPPVQAMPALRRDLAELAKGIKKLLDEEKQLSVGVGQFTAPPRRQAGSGPGLARILQEELRRLGIRINQGARLAVEGRFRDSLDRDTKELSALVEVNVRNDKDEVLVKLSRKITDNAAIAQLLGVDTDLPPGAGPKKNNDRVREELDHPSVFIRGGAVSASRGSPFAVAVLVDGKIRPARKNKGSGKAFARVARGEEYAVQLINRSKNEVAVELTIDGLSMFTFSKMRNSRTGEPYRYVFVRPGRSLVVKGWHRDNRVSDAFLVTSYSKSPVRKLLPNSGSVGIITATFAVATKPPPSLRAGGPLGSPPPDKSATTRGRKVKANFREVERDIGPVQAVVNVRYTR